jgi:hypothetical protein
MRIFFVSTFVGTFLPASVGGDAVRAYGLVEEGVEGVEAVASVLMDRLLGVVSILMVAIAGAMLARDLIDIRAAFPALALLTVSLRVPLDRRLQPACAPIAARPAPCVPAARPGNRHEARAPHSAILDAPSADGECAVCSIAVQVLRVLQTYCLGSRSGLRCRSDLLRAGADHSADCPDADHHQRHWHDAGAVRVALRRAGVASAPAFALSVLFLGIAVVGIYRRTALPVRGKRRRAKESQA